LERQQVSLVKIILQNAILDFENHIRKDSKETCRTIEIRYTVKEQSNSNHHLIVEADKARISQVLLNILNNAYTSIINTEGKETKCIDVSLGRHEEKEQHNANQEKREVAVISICDDGQGIEAKTASKLFTKFDSGRGYGGIDLGLYIAKGVVEAHDGEIWSKNNSDGKGATFHLVYL
jgi:signal transduction histidine kinase